MVSIQKCLGCSSEVNVIIIKRNKIVKNFHGPIRSCLEIITLLSEGCKTTFTEPIKFIYPVLSCRFTHEYSTFWPIYYWQITVNLLSEPSSCFSLWNTWKKATFLPSCCLRQRFFFASLELNQLRCPGSGGFPAFFVLFSWQVIR